jgi:hypothetical protein
VNQLLKSLLLKLPVFQDLRDGRELRRKRDSKVAFPIFVDYEVHPAPRYGYGKPPHAELFQLLNANRERYAKTLLEIFEFTAQLRDIPAHAPEDTGAPYWLNGYLQGLDAASLYAFLCARDPRVYLEIGSGNSTKFARKAICDSRLRTRITSIDPHPRAEVDRLCDETLRVPLEEVDPSVFDTLDAGDILFVDGSHRAFMNSDVTVVFLEVLPRLKRGVLVYIDDIYLPLDYPPEWIERYYSEQYLLAVLLLGDSARYDVFFPCHFVWNHPELRKILDPLWSHGVMGTTPAAGNGFWLQIAEGPLHRAERI